MAQLIWCVPKYLQLLTNSIIWKSDRDPLLIFILVSSHFDGRFFINKPFEWKHKRPGGPTFCIGISQAGTSMTSVAANLASSKVELFSVNVVVCRSNGVTKSSLYHRAKVRVLTLPRICSCTMSKKLSSGNQTWLAGKSPNY